MSSKHATSTVEDQDEAPVCDYCNGDHESEDCDDDACICRHCGETIDNCNDEHTEGSSHVTPAEWKRISRNRVI